MKEVKEKIIERIDAVFLPVKNLKDSLNWYQEVFGFELRWKNERMAGLEIAPNCGFHIVSVEDFKPVNTYTPFNFAVKDLDEIKKRLIQKNVEVSEMRPGEPKRFDMTDLNGNKISVIEL